MNPRVKELWIEALNSGQYEQGSGHLIRFGPGQHPDRFCPLGVLCDLYAYKVGGGFDWSAYSTVPAFFDAGGLFSSVFLPPGVRNWAGLLDRDPLLYWAGGQSRLSYLNDAREFSFEEVARLIEKQL